MNISEKDILYRAELNRDYMRRAEHYRQTQQSNETLEANQLAQSSKLQKNRSLRYAVAFLLNAIKLPLR